MKGQHTFYTMIFITFAIKSQKYVLMRKFSFSQAVSPSESHSEVIIILFITLVCCHGNACDHLINLMLQ